MKGFFAVAAMAMAVTVAAQQGPALSVAVIDVQEIVQESAAGKEAMDRLKKFQDSKVAEGRKLAEDLEGLRRQLVNQRATLAEAKIADLEKQIEDRQVELSRFQDDAKVALEEARRKELDTLERQIMPIINELGREMKLQLIFNKFQSGLVFADEAIDITDQVLRRFNTQVTK